MFQRQKQTESRYWLLCPKKQTAMILQASIGEKNENTEMINPFQKHDKYLHLILQKNQTKKQWLK